MLSVEIKYYNFETCSHQKQLFQDTNSDRVIHNAAMELFRELWNGEPIRLLGIRSSKLSEEGEPQQLSIFDIQPATKKKKLRQENRSSWIEHWIRSADDMGSHR